MKIHKRNQFVICLISFSVILGSCSSHGICEVNNGKFKINKSLKFSLGDDGENVVKNINEEYETFQIPMTTIFNYKNEGYGLYVNDQDGKISNVLLFFVGFQIDDSPRMDSKLKMIEIEGMKFTRNISFSETKEILEENGYSYDVEELTAVFKIKTDLENGYLCTFFFLKDHNNQLQSIQYYAKK